MRASWSWARVDSSRYICIAGIALHHSRATRLFDEIRQRNRSYWIGERYRRRCRGVRLSIGVIQLVKGWIDCHHRGSGIGGNHRRRLYCALGPSKTSPMESRDATRERQSKRVGMQMSSDMERGHKRGLVVQVDDAGKESRSTSQPQKADAKVKGKLTEKLWRNDWQ
ncbi:hypothetical protein BST61_g5421 [Cercospora zeina]